MFTIIFKIENGSDVKVLAEAGANILDLMKDNNIHIDAPCSGNGTCGKCRVRVIAGSVEMDRIHSLPDEDYDDQWRLACQSKVIADATIWVPAEAMAFKEDIKTADISSPEELARYEAAIQQIFDTGIARGVAEAGAGVSEAGDAGAEAGAGGPVGVAIDIGTTTCTAAMLDLTTGKVLGKSSMGNGQIRYGADVINRIIQQSKEGGVEKLRRAVREETILPMVERLLEESGKQEEEIIRYVIAGNTTMEHLFLGADGQSIRLEPYVPEFLRREGDTIESCGLPGKADGKVIFAPNVGSYVGGDITAGALDAMIWNSEMQSLFIDLGTNGELVFGNSDYLLTCACSAGPAFEGGDISCGMRATTGAIDSVEMDADFEPHYSIIGGNSDGMGGRTASVDGSSIKARGLCGSGLISIISELFRTGAVNAKGKFIGHGRRIRYDEEIGSGEYIVAFEEESASGSELTLTESDLDNFIRAKGAIFSAIQTMLKSLDMDVDCIERVIIAGGIGSGIDIEKAISIGMLPKIDLEKYSYIGNSSLTGACAMLLSDEAEQKVFEIADNMTYIELSTYPGYMDELLAACFIPHTDATLFD
ncbi:MAG: DUF4445 domain-containing protein [Lachnospiraceae bacterium]|nr:DUF4445 domain-containing protein [Lachnospiraceae bacterium]